MSATLKSLSSWDDLLTLLSVQRTIAMNLDNGSISLSPIAANTGGHVTSREDDDSGPVQSLTALSLSRGAGRIEPLPPTVRSVQVVPVLEVALGFHEVRRQAQA